jgi:tRNA1(Val) A37 N6-methylase TrmN6
LDKSEVLNIAAAAEILNVSQATIRNWIKSKLLSKNLTFDEISNLKKSIEDGNIQKLNKRANKAQSGINFIPSEYSTNQQIRTRIKKITDIAKKYFKNTDECLYSLAVCFLISKREIFELFGYLEYERSVFQKIIDEYGDNKTLKLDFIHQVRPHLIKLNKLECFDPLGLLYQSLRSEGNKSKNGSYYTPPQITDEIISCLGNKTETFFDPCCGTGSFLLSAAKNKNIYIENIYGSDIDNNAVFIAKINLLLHFRHSAKIPNIYCTNILCNSQEEFLSEIKGKIDVIATNPPWGANKNEILSEEYKNILNSNEIFSMFIAKSLEIIKDKGECIFLLPESILNIKTHANIRKIIATKTTIISIKEFGRAFSRVFTPVILIHFKKTKPDFRHPLKIKTKKIEHKIDQKRFINTKDYIFDIHITTETKNLIKKIYSIPHKTLKNNASWALGIITGNNNKFISTEKSSDNEPVYRGSDITYYGLDSPSVFIKYDRNEFQQVARDEYYRAKEKLIYRFIHNNLIFAYDNKQCLTLNSANILIPDIPGYSIKATLAFLNSQIFQFLFKKKFSTHKVLRTDLEQLPFPKLSVHYRKKLEKLVTEAINNNDVREKIDNEIFKVFKLSPEEIEIIKNL